VRVIDLGALKAEFPQLSNITPLHNDNGGQKEVCRAGWNGRPVMLKLIKTNPSSQIRTDREIAAVKRLASSYVPEIFECGQREICGEVRQYIIEQFIDGQSYRAVLQQQLVQPLPAVLELSKKLLEAVVDFEKNSLVHRDIKPENLLIARDGKLWVIDFGLARHLDLVSATPSGLYGGVGTPGYAPPEQFRNLKPEIDARADLYSIGVVIYESLCGMNPYLRYSSNIVELIQRMESQDLPPLTIPGDSRNEFAAYIACLTQRFPSRRPQSARDAFNWFMPIYSSLKTH
jgi:serine/threonine protein kinase